MLQNQLTYAKDSSISLFTRMKKYFNMVIGFYKSIGDYGDKFYLILKGSVSVMMPQKKPSITQSSLFRGGPKEEYQSRDREQSLYISRQEKVVNKQMSVTSLDSNDLSCSPSSQTSRKVSELQATLKSNSKPESIMNST